MQGVGDPTLRQVAITLPLWGFLLSMELHNYTNRFGLTRKFPPTGSWVEWKVPETFGAEVLTERSGSLGAHLSRLYLIPPAPPILLQFPVHHEVKSLLGPTFSLPWSSMAPRNKGLCHNTVSLKPSVASLLAFCYSEVLQCNRHNEEKQPPYILPRSTWTFESLNSNPVLFVGSH